MSKSITELQPEIVWRYFDEITKIPRPSKHEEKIAAYLIDFAKSHNLEYRTDGIQNVVIYKNATQGMEHAPKVVLQSHMDMVCEKNSDVKFDFTTDPIKVVVDGDWVRAEGTTLGADCGIGMAAQLAVLASDDIPHGALEALFTVDEETGLTGAFNLGEGMISGKYLLNLDSEDEGEIFIGCAGGVDTVATFGFRREAVPDGWEGFRIDISGLTGGHSGDDIEKGYANANKVINRFLWDAARKFGARLSVFNGGNLRNAIPREAYAIFAVSFENASEMTNFFDLFCKKISNECRFSEKNIQLELKKSAVEHLIDAASQNSLLNAIQAVANGVLSVSRSMPGLVETSTNLASVKFQSNNTVIVTTSQRSSVESAKYDAMATVESAFLLGGATVAHSDGYPGWEPKTDSALLNIAENCYKHLFGISPKVRAIHAGLECGLFLKNYPYMEMISFGPTLRGVHSPQEQMEVKTVAKFWDLLINILANLDN